MRRDGWIWLVVVLAVVLLVVLGITGLRLWTEEQAARGITAPNQNNLASEPAALTSSGAAGTTPAGNLPLAKLSPEAGAPGWTAPAPCKSQPLDAAGWSQASSEAQALAAPAFGARSVEMAAPDDPAAAYQALKLNVASGRLNRATGIQLEGFPEITTVGDLLARMEAASAANSAGPAGGEEMRAAMLAEGPDPTFNDALQAVLSGQAITRPVCARIMMLAGGVPEGTVEWAAEQAGPEAARAASPSGMMSTASAPGSEAAGLSASNPRQSSLDWGTASPDGSLAAYTSLGMDEGGPVFVQNLRSGAWTNLIALMNKVRAAEQPELSETDWWTVVDWFPDGQRLMIGRSDVSSVLVVDVNSGVWQAYAFPGEGNGGAPVVDLAVDGSRFVYLGFDADGNQVLAQMDLTSGESTILLRRPLSDGFWTFPRYSPDGSRLAILSQRGDPQAGMSYSIELINLADSTVRELVPGNVGLTVPTWSPDGAYLAFVRPASGGAQQVVEGQSPLVESTNVWVAQVSDGALTQVTTVGGQARSPQWSYDSRTLAFITEDGQVGMATLDAPGQMWAVSTAPAAFPLLSAVFFVP